MHVEFICDKDISNTIYAVIKEVLSICCKAPKPEIIKAF